MAVPGRKSTEKLILSRSSVASDEDLKVYCQPCDRDGPRLPAHGYCTNCCEHLCETCFNLHRRHTMSRNHILLDKANMPQIMSPTTPIPGENLTNPCPKHKIEMIKFYCCDHRVLLCSVCVTLEHTSCKVSYIPDISEKIINGKEYQDVLKEIQNMTEKCDKVMQSVTEMNSKSNESLTNALEHMNKFQTEINERLDQWKEHVEKAVQYIRDENGKNLVTVETINDGIKKSLRESSDMIEKLNTSQQSTELFIKLKQAEQMLENQQQNIVGMTAFGMKEYKFKPDDELSNLLGKDKVIGALIGELSRPVESIEFSDSETRKGSEIFIKTLQDKRNCWITGMVFFTPDLLIITDEANKAVKLVDVKTKSVLDQQELDSSPWDVTTISQDEIAVTLTDHQIIQVLSIGGSKLTKKHTLNVDGECLGICHHKGTLIVSFTNPAKLQILHSDGSVLQTIQGKTKFKYPSYVTTDDQFLFISDPVMKKTVIKLNWSGDVIGRYQCTGKPRGSTMSDDGNIFVCNYKNNAVGEIIENRITERFSVKNPQAICWCSQRKSLFISSLDALQENANYIKIFNLL